MRMDSEITCRVAFFCLGNVYGGALAAKSFRSEGVYGSGILVRHSGGCGCGVQTVIDSIRQAIQRLHQSHVCISMPSPAFSIPSDKRE